MNSKEYWRDREEKHLAQNIKTEAEYAKEIEKIYNNSMAEIQKEIDAFYTKYAGKEGITIAEAKKRASTLDIEAYERKAKKYVSEKNFSKQANEEMRLYNLTMKVNRLELLKSQIGLELVSGFDEMQKFLDEKLTERTLEEFKRQAGILGDIGNAAASADVIVNASFHNATFSQRIWGNQSLLKSEIDKLLQTGLIQGRNPKVLARDLRERFGVSRGVSERLMRTEMARVQVEAQKKSYEASEFDEYEYVACHKGDACKDCSALDGEHFKVKDMMPGENAPPMHPNCHCSTCAYVDEKEYEQWLDSYKDHEMNFKEWQEKHFEAAMGKTAKTATKQTAPAKTVIKARKIVNVKGQVNGKTAKKYKTLTIDQFKKMKHTIAKEERKIIYGRGYLEGYINSRNARKMNGDLREGKPSAGNYRGIADTLQNIIDKNVINDDIIVTRYVRGDALESIAGVKMPKSTLKTRSEDFWDALEDVPNRIEKGHIYTEKGFLSTSGVADKNVMDDRVVKLEIKVPKDTNCYITTNYRESEIIFGQNTMIKITGSRIENSRTAGYKVVLECIIE